METSVEVKMILEERTKEYLKYMEELNTQFTGCTLAPSKFCSLRKNIFERLKAIFKIDCRPFFHISLRPIDNDASDELDFMLSVSLKSTQAHAELLKTVEGYIKRELRAKKKKEKEEKTSAAE